MLDILLKVHPISPHTVSNILTIVLCILLVILFIGGFLILQWRVYKNFFTWKDGRQKDCIYRKMCLMRFKVFRFGMDMYILKYQPRAHLTKHIDQLPKGKHYRLNVELRGKGVLYVDKVIYRWKSFIVFFRPDLHPHSMVNGKRKRTVLSIGFGFFKKTKKMY